MDTNANTNPVTDAAKEFEQRIADLEKKARWFGRAEIKLSFFIYVFISGAFILAVTKVAERLDLATALASKESLGFALGAVALALIVGWFGFVAFKRLELYDDELNRIRTSIDTRSDKLRVEIQASLTNIDAKVRSQIDVVFAKALHEQAEKIETLSGTADETLAKLARYDFLRERAAAETSVHIENGILSLEAVHTEAQTNFQRANALDSAIAQDPNPSVDILAIRDSRRAEAIELVRQALAKDIRGDSADYHNLSAELGRNDYYVLAVEVLERGTKRFPANTDLIADAIQTAISTGDLNLTETYFAKLRQFDWSKWTWRGFAFSIQYLIAKGDEQQAEFVYNKALEFMPWDEHPIVQYSELFLRRGQYAKVEEILESGLKRLKSAPQTASRLADVYIEQGRYADAMLMAQTALRMDAQDQSGTNNAALHLTIGLAGDAQWCEQIEKMGTVDPSTEEFTELVQQARRFLVHYAAARTTPNSGNYIYSAVSRRLPTIRSYLMALGLSKDNCRALFDELGLLDNSTSERKEDSE